MIEVLDSTFENVYQVNSAPWVLITVAFLILGSILGIVIFKKVKRPALTTVVSIAATVAVAVPLTFWAASENAKLNESLTNAWVEAAHTIAAESGYDAIVFQEPIPVYGQVTAAGSPFSPRNLQEVARATAIKGESKSLVWVVMHRSAIPGVRMLVEVRAPAEWY